MTENEAIARIRYHFEVHHHDNRPHPLLDEAVDTAIKALEEVQQYRQIGKISTCKNAVEICKAMIERGIDPDNIADYIKFEDNLMQRGYDLKRLLEMMEKNKQYCQIGTVEECRNAVEKIKQKRVTEKYKSGSPEDIEAYGEDAIFATCPTCGQLQNILWNSSNCGECGQALDWRTNDGKTD